MISRKLSELNQGFKLTERMTVWLPNWAKNTTIQQGLITVLTTLFSLVLMASISLAYVDYELNQRNDKIIENTVLSQDLTQSQLNSNTVDDDYILTVLATSFVISGLLVAGLSSAIVISMTQGNKRRIERLERVLAQAAEGKFSTRTGETHKLNDLARIEVAVDEMLSRLEGSVNAMSDISTNIAHELKTPITRLQHNLINLKDSAEQFVPDDSSSFHKELDLALSESQRLASVFDALLRISQIESGARRSRFSHIDLNEILATVADIYVDVAEDADMTLSIQPAEHSLWVQGDRELLIQQLANLIENALKYCPLHSQIVLSCEVQGNHAYLKVCDDGLGISDSEKKRVFERFYRVDKGRTDAGLGLGLPFVKAVARLHHGDIELYDNNTGLGVKITLPLSSLHHG